MNLFLMNYLIELSNGKLEFEICSDGCIRKKVVVCYDAQNIDSSMKGECESNQCEFQAGVLEADKKYLWFMSPKMATSFTSEICETAILKSPKVIPSFATTASEKSCEPLKRDGNVVQLFVKEFGCSLKVVSNFTFRYFI
uniref:Uncharacterized protein n=1 Tax=Panagrolaimus superbus TaxID=310955 RepID=A0A914Z709_9BILA